MNTLLLPLLYFVLINIAMILLGWIFIRQQTVILCWLMLVGTVLAIHFIFINASPVIRMLAIIATTFTGMKVISVTEGYKNKALKLTFIQWLVYAIGWAGMRAQPFETLGAPALPNAWPMIRFGITRIIAGLLLILLAHGILLLHLPGMATYSIVSVVLLIGLSLILHFGILNISAGSWRLHGVNTYLLFRQPAKSLSLTEFWSKRWNIAFSEMTSVAIFRPLKNKIGSAGALVMGFAFSGILHELALSVPVNSGYGLPLLYFVIQGSLVLLEKALTDRGATFLQNKAIAHIWVFFWVVIPAPLLFHTAFITKVVWPLAAF
jgi:hypothetical protein